MTGSATLSMERATQRPSGHDPVGGLPPRLLVATAANISASVVAQAGVRLLCIEEKQTLG